jgi:hypothetical protein
MIVDSEHGKHGRIADVEAKNMRCRSRRAGPRAERSQFLRGCGEVIEARMDTPEEQVSIPSADHARGAPFEETTPEETLEIQDAPRDCRLRTIERVGRPTEVANLVDQARAAQRAERRILLGHIGRRNRHRSQGARRAGGPGCMRELLEHVANSFFFGVRLTAATVGGDAR